MSDPDKELLDRIKTREELEKRGYIQVTCPRCNGSRGIIVGETMHVCYSCNGQGYTMEQQIPLTELTKPIRDLRKNQRPVTAEEARAQAKRVMEYVRKWRKQ